MKKFFVIFGIFALVFLIGCGSDKNKEESEKSDTGDTEAVTDADPTDTGDTEVVPDTDSTDSMSQKYPEEFAAYSYDSFVPNSIVEQLFGIKMNGEGCNYKDDRIIVNKREKSVQVVMNREMVSFENAQELEDMIDDQFNEAKNMAEALTSVQLKNEGTLGGTSEAVEVGDTGESIGKMIDSVIFVFWPVLDEIPIFAESIEVEYDAKGFYQLRSNVPYSVSEIRRSAIKSEKQVEEEIYSALGKEEEKIIAYVENEDGEFILSAVAKDDENMTFLTISLEADHD